MAAKDEGGLSLDQDTQVGSPPIVSEALSVGGKEYSLSLCSNAIALM